MHSQMDLKNGRLFAQDGYSNVGAVNLLAGYAIGLATMAIDSLTGIIGTGTVFTVAGDDTEYEVISHTETSGNTTSITFIPGLVAMAVDGAVLTFHPHRTEVRIGEGNLTWTEKLPREYKLNKGKLDTVRNGDEAQVEVKFDFVWDSIISVGDEPITLKEALTRTGQAAAWVSSSANRCEPYSVDLIFINTPICDDEEAEQVVFEDFRPDQFDYDAKAGTVACSGASNRTTPTVTRIEAA